MTFQLRETRIILLSELEVTRGTAKYRRGMAPDATEGDPEELL